MTGSKTHGPVASRVILGTLAAIVVPGSGHLLAGKVRMGLVLLGTMGAGVALAVVHLTHGIAALESHLGGFLFPVLLRGLVILHAFNVLDAYLWGIDPSTRHTFPARRQAVLLNLLLPGAGYLMARAWLRMGTGFALLVLIVIFARAGSHPYLDVIYVGMQAIMAVAVYHQMSQRLQIELDRSGRQAPLPPVQVGAGQVIVLLVMVATAGALGYLVYQALPATTSLTGKDIEIRPDPRGVKFVVPRLGFSMTATGPNWIGTPNPGSGFLFAAQHKQGASLMVGIQQIPNYVHRQRYLERVRQWMETKGLVHRRSLELTIGGRRAVQMRFSGQDETGPVNHWTVVVPSPAQKLAYLLIFRCTPAVCQRLLPQLEQTRDSFQLK